MYPSALQMASAFDTPMPLLLGSCVLHSPRLDVQHPEKDEGMASPYTSFTSTAARITLSTVAEPKVRVSELATALQEKSAGLHPLLMHPIQWRVEPVHDRRSSPFVEAEPKIAAVETRLVQVPTHCDCLNLQLLRRVQEEPA